MPQKLPRRGSVYYFRRVIPNDLKGALGCNEKCFTLGTKDLAEAKRRWRKRDYEFQLYLDDVRRQVREGSWTYPHTATGPVAPPMDRETYAIVMEQSLEASDPEVGPDDDNRTYEEWERDRKARDRLEDAEWFAEERRTRSVPLLDLFDQYASQTGIRGATARQWRSVLRHFVAFLKHDNALAVVTRDIRRWRDHLATEPTAGGGPRSAKTINGSYLAAVRAAFSWGVERDLMEANPTLGVKPLRKDRPTVLRDRNLTRAEQQIILEATLARPSDRLGHHKAASRRWVPWLCAYTGARVSEITQARAHDVALVDGVWTLNITPDAGATKTNRARTVPLHPHLLEQGFLNFVEASTGPLFYAPRAEKPGARPQAKIVSNRLSDWVRTLGVTEVPQPNHSWRHTFKTVSRSVGIPEEAADYILGHAPATEGRKYGSHDLPALAVEVAKMPRFPQADHVRAPANQDR